MKDATAGKSFLEDINTEINYLKKYLFLTVFFVVVFYIIMFGMGKDLDSSLNRISELETKMQQQESLTREALGVDHKERVQAVYNINY